MRLFVACDFSPGTLTKVTAFAQDLRASLGGVPIRWVSAELYHLTLQFLGEVPENKLGAIETSLASVAKRHRKIPAELAGAGCFPSLKQPQVVWVGLRPNPALNRLTQDLRAALGTLGFADENRFKAHLTLGRLDKHSSEDQKARVSTQVEAVKDFVLGPDEFAEIVLYRSVLYPRGPVYTGLYRARLESMLN